MDYKGLRWYKCDFHLHTMSSLCYKNREKDTVDDWVDETISKGLQCIAITDHNDYRGIDGIKNIYEIFNQEVEENYGRDLSEFMTEEIECI